MLDHCNDARKSHQDPQKLKREREKKKHLVENSWTNSMYYPQTGVSGTTDSRGKRTLREILVSGLFLTRNSGSGSLSQENSHNCGETSMHKSVITVMLFIYVDDGDRLSAQH